MRILKVSLAALLIAGGIAIDLQVFAEEQSTGGKSGEVKERAVPAPPPYHCGSGVCLCVGQANCDQLTQPAPCKRQKFCIGQTASPQPPPEDPSRKPTQSTARTITGNFVMCSCRAGQ